MTQRFARFTRLAVLLSLFACTDDPLGPAGVVVIRRVDPRDSVLVGAPGRALADPVLFQVLDGEGRPVGDAAVSWAVVGTNGRVNDEQYSTNPHGTFSAVWVLGTVASQAQALIARVDAGRRVAVETVTAVARPAEIRSLAFSAPDTMVVKLGVPTQLVVEATDPFGNRFVPVGVTFVSFDTSLCRVDGLGVVRVGKRGLGRVAVVAAGVADTVVIHGTQVAKALVVSSDTLHFNALGQADGLTVQLLDDQGQLIQDSFPPISQVDVGDTSIAERFDSLTIRARGNGLTYATLSTVGLTSRVVIDVNQVPVTLNARVTFPQPIVTLPVGASVPMLCQVLDENQYPVARAPVLLGSARGHVSGTGCDDIQVLGSGYDTLVFAMGSIQSRVPVIIATEPDSVGVLAAAQPLTVVQRDSFVGEDLTKPQIVALRPLVADILAAYGNPTTNLDRARAIRDWVARTAVYPDPAAHPDSSTSNRSVLPPGTTWADLNSVLSLARWDSDATYWSEQFYDGYAMLDRLLGTLDPGTGIRADDGMMVHVAGARYRIRDIDTYRYPLCTYEAIIATALWAAAGLQGIRVSTLDHDAAAVFIPELGRWVYEDPTFDEEYRLDGVGDPLSPEDLLTLSTAGEADRMQATKMVGPDFDPATYLGGRTYMSAGHPEGMVIIGSQLYQRVVGAGGTWIGRYVQVDVPRLSQEWPFSDPLLYDPVPAAVAFPKLGVVFEQQQVVDSVVVVQLGSTVPDHDHFERRVAGGVWQRVSDTDVLPVGQCRVEYRSVDGSGHAGAIASLDVWLPRAPGFLGVASSGVRRQTSYCS